MHLKVQRTCLETVSSRRPPAEMSNWNKHLIPPSQTVLVRSVTLPLRPSGYDIIWVEVSATQMGFEC